MVTAVCNVFINSDIKFGFFKQTFPRVYAISDNWLINIRGKYRQKVQKYIQENLPNSKETCQFFSGLDDTNWAKSTGKMLEKSKYDYIYVFLEDHFLLKPLDHFQAVIQDMINSKIEYFAYSFFNIGLTVQSAEGLYPNYSQHFFSFEFSEKNLDYLKEHNSHFYPYSLTSVCRKKYFQKLLAIEKKALIKVPFLVQALMENCLFIYPKNRAFWFQINKLVSVLGIRFVCYPIASPFNLEKSLFDYGSKLLPLTVGGLKEELFANWDDDNKLSNSSLIKRGLYPLKFTLDTPSRALYSCPTQELRLKKGETITRQFYPDKSRLTSIPTKILKVVEGELQIVARNKIYYLKAGEELCCHANIPHTITAQKDSTVKSGVVYA